MDVDTVPESGSATVDLYHGMMRRALVDWGDHILDTICQKCPDMVEAIESVRADIIDPLR